MKNHILLIAAILLPTHAMADYACNVSVSKVLIYESGVVNVLHSGRGDYTVICNLNSTYGTASPSVCAMWTGLLLGVKKRNGTASMYFSGDGSCATLPTYGSAPVPVYIGDSTP